MTGGERVCRYSIADATVRVDVVVVIEVRVPNVMLKECRLNGQNDILLQLYLD